MPGLIIPPRKRPNNDNEYFEILSKAVFQAGFSFKVVHDKWSGISKFFHNFDTERIADWGAMEVADALENPDMIRNTKKIKAIISNAQRFNELVEEHGSFSNYVDTITRLPYEERKKLLVSNFKWLGKTGAYFFLYCIDDDVPNWEER